MPKEKKINETNSIKVLVTPWEKGFTCGIVINSKASMSTEEYELCSTIARGMIKVATSDPKLHSCMDFVVLLMTKRVAQKL
jgi:hypothetical protein